ncbi:MAG: tetratricopeptide repeat-containing sensor histidine kinase [Bacteroidota bacterium]
MRRSFTIVFLLSQFFTFSQDQSVADSLILALNEEDLSDSLKLHLIVEIARNHNHPSLREKYAKMLIEEGTRQHDLNMVGIGYLHVGQSHRMRGNVDLAIDALIKSLDFAKKADSRYGIYNTLGVLGDTYSISGRHRHAIKSYQECIAMIGDQDSTTLAIALNNLGDTYYTLEVYDSALMCFHRSKRIREYLKYDPSGMAHNFGNIGLGEIATGKLDSAEYHIKLAIQSFEKLKNHNASASYLGAAADIYYRKRHFDKAIDFADSSLAIARKYGLKADIRDNLLRLASIYEEKSRFDKAYAFHKQYVTIKDSIASEDVHTRIENMETEMKLAQKQSEIDVLTLQKHKQQLFIVAVSVVLVILGVLSYLLYRFYLSKSRMNTILEEQKSSLERLNETKDKFFSIISHDLRGPVTSFMGVGRMIKQLVATKNVDRLMDVADEVEVSVERLSSLLDQLLNWSLQQRGHFPNVPEKVSLNNLVTDVLDTFLTMASGKRIRLVAKIDEKIDLWVDNNMMETIIRNLVNNALKFTDEGGLVTVSAHLNGDQAEIHISDTGVGISKKQLDGLFKFYAKKPMYGTEGEKGLGLGLQLVYEFLALNNGAITVSSEEGKGTTFTLYLPLFETVTVDAVAN